MTETASGSQWRCSQYAASPSTPPTQPASPPNASSLIHERLIPASAMLSSSPRNTALVLPHSSRKTPTAVTSAPGAPCSARPCPCTR